MRAGVQAVANECEVGRDLMLVHGPVEGPVEPLLTATDVAGILCVRPKRVYELGIPVVRISERALRWRRCDVVAWIEARRTA